MDKRTALLNQNIADLEDANCRLSHENDMLRREIASLRGQFDMAHVPVDAATFAAWDEEYRHTMPVPVPAFA
jgi:hypothetical protein